MPPPPQEPLRTRLERWRREQEPAGFLAAPDQAIRVSAVAETGPWEHFGQRVWLDLWERGLWRPLRDRAVVADGSDHLDHVVEDELRLPGIQLTPSWDVAQAQEPLWAVSHAAFGEGSAAGAAWVQAPLTALERGQVEEVGKQLETLAAQWEETTPGVAAVALQGATSFTRRRDQVAYPRLVAAGAPDW